jgi:hypothetical protein
MIKVIGDPIQRDGAETRPVAKKIVTVPVTKLAVTKPDTKVAKADTKVPHDTKVMGRPRKWGSEGEKCRAYRERNRDRLQAIGKASADLKRKLAATDG